MRPLSVALLLPCVFVLACSGDEAKNNKTMATNTSVNMTSVATMTTTTTGTDMPPLTYQSRYETRFVEMTLRDGDKIPAYRALNGLIRQNIKAGVNDPIVILAAFRDIDPAAGTLRLRAGSGLEDVSAGEYTWDPETADEYTPGTLEKGSGAFTGKIDNFTFVASLVGGKEKTLLKIRNLEFSGKLTRTDNDVQADIVEGMMSGHITKADADQTMLIIIPGSAPQALTSLFKEENLNLDTSGDGTLDAWSLRANYKAEATVINN